MTQKNSEKNGNKNGAKSDVTHEAPATEKTQGNGAHVADNDTLVKALKAEWRKNGSKPMTEAQGKEIKSALAKAKELQHAAAKAMQDAEDAESNAIALVVKYSGSTTVTIDGKRHLISCRGKSLFLKSMPVFDEGVTI